MATFNCTANRVPFSLTFPSQILFPLESLILPVILIRLPSQSSTKMPNSLVIKIEIVVGGRIPSLCLLLLISGFFIFLSKRYYSFSSDHHNLWPARSPSAAGAQDDVVSVERNGNSTAADMKWELCGAVDYIPCFDDLEAVANLSKRKLKRSFERDCLKSSLRCLVPLPAGYRTPIPWPNSRDTVRLIR